ncbi:MAG: tRNA (adenine(22)-N(1))-methyltransferase TrmK [Clostridiaceae bacterium]
MEISNRLVTIANMIDNCESMVDVGTDHGYIPIYLCNNNKIKQAIASDINKGPIEKAKRNITDNNLTGNIQCRLGGGLTTIKPGEVKVAVIAGMGGNLIRDIIEERYKVFKSLEYAILQPVQNPEVLRKYLYEKGIKIIEEKIIKDEGIYYEILKVKHDNNPKVLDEIIYEVGDEAISSSKNERKEFILFKIEEYEKIISRINLKSESALKRKLEIENKITKLKEMIS